MTAVTEVTGLSLFTLCHYFGRRGRAMASSLSNQEGCETPIELTVFFSRSVDKSRVLEGLADGPRTVKAEFVEVPPDRIMQRALHYSRAHERHVLSHTVFVDSDLWFPPTFFREFAQALKNKGPGYWSCRVMSIPVPVADKLVEGWKEICQDKLDAVAAGRHLDHFGGRAGHFQCIPRDLSAYPESGANTVSESDLAFSTIATKRSLERRWERRISRIPAYHLGHPHVWTGTGGREL